MPCLCYCFIGKLKMSQLVNPEIFHLQSILFFCLFFFATFGVAGREKKSLTVWRWDGRTATWEALKG